MWMHLKYILSALCNRERNRNTSGNGKTWSIERGSCRTLLHAATLAHTLLPSIFYLVEITSLCTWWERLSAHEPNWPWKLHPQSSQTWQCRSLMIWLPDNWLLTEPWFRGRKRRCYCWKSIKANKKRNLKGVCLLGLCFNNFNNV